ncbi:hypothetical protein BDZ91DRAFT_745767 [Kalaharituber pfeilii]|nr:hypothetical protein BDZ91DRAFT_745767 [Kalaharituber pfeilii]
MPPRLPVRASSAASAEKFLPRLATCPTCTVHVRLLPLAAVTTNRPGLSPPAPLPMAASAPVSLSAPYTLFPLAPPAALQSKSRADGKESHFRPCYTSLVEAPSSKKRKRVLSEIAAAVDGEGVNIYDVSSAQVISSYATPTATKFSCVPASIRTSDFSQTYAASSLPKRQIWCWRESKTAEVGSPRGVSTFTRNVDTAANVFLLKNLPGITTGSGKKSVHSGDVLALFTDSQVSCYSSDLSEERWSSKLSTGQSDEVVYATMITPATAKNTILRNRPDVLFWNSLPATDNLETNELALLTITSNRHACAINLYSVLTSIPSRSNTKPVHHLLTVPIQSLSLKPSSVNPAFTIHFPSGTLHCLVNAKLISYSLFTTTPSLLSTVPLRNTTPQSSTENISSSYSLLSVSSTMVLISTPYELSLYETRYSSLQATVIYSTDTASGNDAKPTHKDVLLSVFLDNMDLAVGYSPDGIVGIQMSIKEQGTKFSSTTGLLINSICRGVEDLSIANTMLPSVSHKTHEKESKKKRQEKKKAQQKGVLDDGPLIHSLQSEQEAQKKALKKLRRSKRKQDIFEFEEIFAEYVWVQRDEEQLHVYNEWKKSATAAKSVEKGLTNGVCAEHGDSTEDGYGAISSSSAPEPPEYLTPNSNAWKKMKPSKNLAKRQEKMFCWRPLSEKFITSVLGMIFVLKQDGSRLEISFFPTNVVKYLVESGTFSLSMLRLSEIQQREAMALSAVEVNQGSLLNDSVNSTSRRVGQGGFVDCLVEYDPSLTHLAWFLREAGEIDIGEIIAAVKLVLARLHSPQQPLLSDAAVEEEDEERRLQRLTYEAELALDRASQALEESGVLEEVLRLSMRRLNAFPPEMIVRGLKLGLEEEELMGLVRILRREMMSDRQGDCDQSNDEEGIPGEHPAFEAADVELICEILTCALDAVGVAGLVLANDTVIGHRSSSLSIGFDGELDAYSDHDESNDPQDGNKLLISSLHSEVSHVVSALQEAASLSGLIGEMIRHAGGLKKIDEEKAYKQPLTPKQWKLRHQERKAFKAQRQNNKEQEYPTQEITARAPSSATTKPTAITTATPRKQAKPSVMLQTPPTHIKYLKHRRAERLSELLPQRSSPALSRIPHELLKAKLFAAGLSIPASIRNAELLKERQELKRREKKSKEMEVRLKEKEKMLPLGLPLSVMNGGIMGMGEMYTAGGVGEVKEKSKRKMREEERRAVGMYSLEKWVV